MTLEEESKWLKNFDSYLNWNEPVIAKKSPEHLRNLLESFLDASMVSELQMDELVTEDTLVRGPGGLLETLRNYFVDNYPLINCRHVFSTCKQARGELFRTWWETKLRKAKECDLEMMASKDWLALELIWGVSDTMLQKKLLQEQDPSLKQLVCIAEQWQAADSAQTAFGSEATEYVCQAYTEEEREETEYIRKASNYKREINEQWKTHCSKVKTKGKK
jgi:hypothetical protein